MTSDNIKPGMFIEIKTDFSYTVMLILEEDINSLIFKVIEATHGVGLISYQLVDLNGTIRTDTLEKLKQAVCKIAFTSKKWN